ncbi:MAG: tRNA (cytosine(32)/uridine(32)-2'-O)-methyltransferase TrmJ, partial [Acidobacteria bacterium]|nr:tRNA (cytosine(32)/uridine(32)-2'-O)-methyltransferase TrmJ [Acidobacteriota bacterium]NIQ86094.1 tRNA (cytosine(32)/uridine(32)-2'-O)-methyltransferase TrmJ [Acidobacteriota bacterium]
GVHATLDTALAGAQTVIGTTARTGKQRKPHYRIDTLAEQVLRRDDPGELALVFGREDRGLHDDDLDRCTHLVYLPADETYTSFNLAQAVLLTGWELRRAGLAPA